MLVFFYGSDAYRLKQAKDEIVNRYKTKYSSGVNLYSFDFSENADLGPLENTLKSSSFFSEHKLIVCKNIFDKKTVSESVGRYLKEHNIIGDPDITLVAVESLSEKGLAAKNKNLFELLANGKNTVRNIEPLAGVKLADWVRKEFELRGCNINSDAIRNLVELTGDDSWNLVNEIEKLAAYKREGIESGGSVTVADIKSLVLAKTDLNIFELIDALGAKNRPEATQLLFREIKTGRDPYYILTMFIYQFRNLLTIKDLQERKLSEAEISKKAKLHPFVVKKTLKSPFNLEEAKKTYKVLLSLDTNFKSGEVDLKDSLYGLIL